MALSQPIIGILMLDTKFPRIVGDIGNENTFSFPVRYKVVRDAFPERVVHEGNPALLQPFIKAAKELEDSGVKAIFTSCGFLALYQRELAETINVPIFTSSLLQIPLLNVVIGKDRKIGVLTASAKALTKRHLAAVGAENISLVIGGMDKAEAFTRTFILNQAELDVEKVTAEMFDAVRELLKECPAIGALVLECTNMPPYAKEIQKIINIPVFDIVTLVNYVYSSLERVKFQN